jgi:predicted RNase H-like HicB family nuclease
VSAKAAAVAKSITESTGKTVEELIAMAKEAGVSVQDAAEAIAKKTGKTVDEVVAKGKELLG